MVRCSPDEALLMTREQYLGKLLAQASAASNDGLAGTLVVAELS
jgi:hypothetical protein